MIQRLIRTGVIIRIGVIGVWWDVVGCAGWLASSCRWPRSWWWSYSRSILYCYTQRKEAEVGRLERGKYLSSKSALSEITVFLVVGL
jgi:hypothetical protein